MPNQKTFKHATLIQPVIERAQTDPEHPALIFINPDNTEETISAGQFHFQALAFAQALQRIGVGQEDLVILVLQHSKVLLASFWGALYLGALPSIFPFLTEKLDPEIYMQRVKALVGHSEAKVVITYPEFKDELSRLLSEANCQVLSTDDVPEVSADPPSKPVWKDFSGDKIAFLQHSSGTTGLQKGVALSHQAVLNQIEAYSRAIDLQPNDVIVSWLPLYHDMGLIAGFVMPIVAGIPLVLMSPFHWISDPKILMWAIHNHRGTLCWLPNFAYNHLARALRPRYIEGLNLETLRMVINCSEPVHLQSHQTFFEKFSPYRLKEQALSSSYAMAENTFAVTQYPAGKAPHVDWVQVAPLQEQRKAVPANEGDQGSIPMVSCGLPIEGTQVEVVNDTGEVLPPRQVGEIILRGNCMLDGYHMRPDLTSETIRDGWYYTGDMGYIADEHVFISGRLKDLIIVGGKNVYPQDLEAIANTVKGIYPGRAVAFGMFDERIGSETIVMVCELRELADEQVIELLERILRQEIVKQTEVTLADVRLVEQRWLIKTSSGKIARSANRDKYIREFLD